MSGVDVIQNIPEQAILRVTHGKEYMYGLKRNDENITARAYNMSADVEKLFSGDSIKEAEAKRALRTEFQKVAAPFGINNFEELQTKKMDSTLTDSQRQELNQLDFDVRDALALGTLWGVRLESKDPKILAVIAELISKDPTRMEAIIGINEFKGTGEVLAKTIITDKTIWRAIQLLEETHNVTSADVAKSIDHIVNAQRDYRINDNDDEALMVKSYLSSLQQALEWKENAESPHYGWAFKSEHMGDMSFEEQFDFISEVFADFDRRLLETKDITAGKFREVFDQIYGIFDGVEASKGAHPFIVAHVQARRHINDAYIPAYVADGIMGKFANELRDRGVDAAGSVKPRYCPNLTLDEIRFVLKQSIYEGAGWTEAQKLTPEQKEYVRLRTPEAWNIIGEACKSYKNLLEEFWNIHEGKDAKGNPFKFSPEDKKKVDELYNTYLDKKADDNKKMMFDEKDTLAVRRAKVEANQKKVLYDREKYGGIIHMDYDRDRPVVEKRFKKGSVELNEFDEFFADRKQVIYTWFDDADKNRQAVMKEFMIWKLQKGKDTPRERDKAKQAFEIANRLYRATGEDQWFNKDSLGPADISKMMNLRYYRCHEYIKGKNCGAYFHMNKIERVYTSLVRMISSGVERTLPDGTKIKPAGEFNEYLTADEINVEEDYGKMDYTMWSTVIGPSKAKPLYEVLMSTKAKREEWTTESMEKLFDCAVKAGDFVKFILTDRSFDGKDKVTIAREVCRLISIGMLINTTQWDNDWTTKNIGYLKNLFCIEEKIPVPLIEPKVERDNRDGMGGTWVEKDVKVPIVKEFVSWCPVKDWDENYKTWKVQKAHIEKRKFFDRWFGKGVEGVSHINFSK